MQLEFAADADGEREARVVQHVVRVARSAGAPDAHEIQLLDQLDRACAARLGEHAGDATAAAHATDGSWWRRLLGPSRREVMLSEQRNQALARAERAERSSFEALAETARVARERDALEARVAELEAGAASSP